jgi:hypothetical protein
MPAIAEKYWYTFRASNGLTVSVLRGDGAPKPTDGIGGWQVVARPRRTALTQWMGRNPYAMDVPVVFDGINAGVSIEGDIAKLFQMGVGSDFDPPPTVHVDGGLPIKGATWVINGIDWGDDVIWQQDGASKPYRARQDAVVHLLQYKPEARVKILATKSLPNVYTVHSAKETMRTIAKVMYGDGSQWTKIKSANPNVRDPNHLKVGTKLRIP